jgi:hypothetical protein
MDDDQSDDLLSRVLGPNLQMATLRLVAGLAVVSAIVAALSKLLS